MESHGPSVAIIDDDETVRRALRRMIASLGYRPVEFATGEAFLADNPYEKFVCALIDLHMSGLNGIDVVTHLRDVGNDMPTIIITGGDEPKLRDRCINAGASVYMVKPVERKAMLAAIIALVQ